MLRFPGLMLFSAILVMPLPGLAREAYRFDKAWGVRGTANGQFQSISGLAIQGDRLYISDAQAHRVQVFDLEGNFLGKFGRLGSGNYNLRNPRDVDLHANGDIYLADAGNYRIHRRTPTFSYLNLFGSYGTAANQFDNLRRITVDSARQRVYALNGRRPATPCLSQWRTTGQFVRAFGDPGDDEDQFQTPLDLIVDGSGNLYVSDDITNSITKFDRNGVFLRRFNRCLGRFFSDPCSLAVDSANNLYILDYMEAMITKVTAAGTEVCVAQPQSLTWAEIDHVAVDAWQRLYISNHWYRIERYRLNQPPLPPAVLYVTPASPDSGRNLVAKPSGATDPDGDSVVYRYLWQCSTDAGVTWDNTANTARTLKAVSTAPGQHWRVRVRAFDGDAFSSWLTSNPVLIRPA